MNFDEDDEDPEIRSFRAEVRTWFRRQMRGSDGLAWSAIWSTRVDDAEYEFRCELARKLGRKGWLFPTYPTEYGGGGLSHRHQIVVETEIRRYGLDLSRLYYTLARIVAPCILRWGTPEQCEQFLPGMTRGEVCTWQVLTEPHGGSDIANCKTIARRDGDCYVVNGQKIMVGSTHAPDFMWTLVCTDPAGDRHKNLSWMYIPGNTPGIDIVPLPMIMGLKNTVYFDDAVVPAENLIGGENNGWAVGATHLELEHGGAGRIASDPVEQKVISHCRNALAVNGGLNSATRLSLADLLIEAHALRLIGLRNFWFRLIGEPHSYGGAQQTYYERMVRLRNARRIQDIIGTGALVEDLSSNESEDLQYVVRSGPAHLHGGGTQDTDRLIIARRLGLGGVARESAPSTI